MGITIRSSVSRFENWFPYFGGNFKNILNGSCELGYGCKPNSNCSAELATYRDAFATNNRNVDSACFNVYNCILDGLSPRASTMFASSQVMLGFTPSLLAMIPPSMEEIAILSSQRKILLLVLSFTNPVVFVPRPFTYTGPLSVLHAREQFILPRLLLRMTGFKVYVASVLQFLLAPGAMVNVLDVSWQLGVKTVIPWNCNARWIPILWTVIPATIHLINFAGWYFMRRMEKFEAYHHEPTSRFAWAASEFRISSNNGHTGKSGYLHQLLEEHSKVRLNEGPGTILLNQLAGLFAFVNLMFGTYIFSSLTCTMFYDTFMVVARYMASAIVCRLIVIWELEGTRTAEEDTLRATRGQGNAQEDDISKIWQTVSTRIR